MKSQQYPKLKKTKKDVMAALEYVINCYAAYKSVKMKDAKMRTLKTYSDFYEWLRGDVC